MSIVFSLSLRKFLGPHNRTSCTVHRFTNFFFYDPAQVLVFSSSKNETNTELPFHWKNGCLHCCPPSWLPAFRNPWSQTWPGSVDQTSSELFVFEQNLVTKLPAVAKVFFFVCFLTDHVATSTSYCLWSSCGYVKTLAQTRPAELSSRFLRLRRKAPQGGDVRVPMEVSNAARFCYINNTVLAALLNKSQ